MSRQFSQWIVLLLLGVLLAVSPSVVHAESSLVLGEILKKTETNYQQIQAFTAYFHQWTTSAAASAMTTEASGKLYYEKPRQMRWEYEKPELQTFVANHQLAWLYVPSEKQISLFDAKSLFASPLAQTFFDGIVEVKNHFDVTMDLKQSNNASAVLKLIPKKEDPNIQSLFLWIDLQTYQITTIESHDVLGNTNRIMLDSQTSIPRLDHKLFQLTIPSSTVVVDMEGKQLSPSEIEKLKLRLLPKQEK